MKAMVQKMLGWLFMRVPACFRRFPDGWCFYISNGQLSALNRLQFSGWKWATWNEVWSRYRKYWRHLPVLLYPSPPAKNWW